MIILITILFPSYIYVFKFKKVRNKSGSLLLTSCLFCHLMLTGLKLAATRYLASFIVSPLPNYLILTRKYRFFPRRTMTYCPSKCVLGSTSKSKSR
ncbi:hypothetical protein EFO61_04405 [Lacticaseibacillus rhamnosus]|nr:hypothetical protein BVH57_05500 [Lacticaseibacillus rhamnosus]MCT3145690.1 hypothetical protein [Lacticaseibacillus rhamnosus]MCT3152178.1 hypothetical protein [Lacticaseibacillus rhamnosus]MCT3161230.1 hypothetical protein [Lacticaseibacillus rhamnosus]MCT3164857.1 hypothetical protein [Lacticaseibacillus rhamnosus]